MLFFAQMLQAIKEHLCAAKDGEEGAKSSGGGGSVLGAVRRQHTLPALFFIALQLAIRFHANREQVHKVTEVNCNTSYCFTKLKSRK